MRKFKMSQGTVEAVSSNSIVIELITTRYGIKTTADMSLVEFKDHAAGLVANPFAGATTDGLELPEYGPDGKVIIKDLGEVEAGTFKAATVDKSLFTIRKKLFDSQEWKDIKNFDQSTYRWIQTKALKSNLRSGFYRLPNALYESAEKYLDGRKLERQVLVEAFVAAYDQLREGARLKLGPAFNLRDYDTLPTVRGRFSFDYNIVEESVPTKLKSLSSTAYKREVAKQGAKVAREVEAMVGELRGGFATIVSKYLELSAPEEEGGTPKVVRQVTLDNINEFLDIFDAKNLAGDHDLAGLVKDAKKVFNGVTDKKLKADEEARKSIRASCEGFASKIGLELKAGGGRKVRKLD